MVTSCHHCILRFPGDTLDDELDFYRDDDDVAVLFSDAAGKKVWVIGNIEEVAVVRGTVEQQRAVGGASKDYLLKLDKDYRPAGVYVDDPKGAFDHERAAIPESDNRSWERLLALLVVPDQ